MARADQSAKKLHKLTDDLCAAGQADMVDAAVVTLQALLNGAVALGHVRRFPGFAAEAVAHAVVVSPSPKPKKASKRHD
ncbi:MAG TPA: hypothetical protein VME43_04930 [Bryobacteraceae bacterium]|nr:hypothetical protein [Bryobacteraceae bacterium]